MAAGHRDDRIDRLVDLLVDADALVLGDLVTRSGRPTPYFLDLGRISRGDRLATLGGLYADQVVETFGDGIDVLFGPAYKGIPLAVATATALAARGVVVGVAHDRKEAKDHGEGGRLVGAELVSGARAVIIEDVTTAGTSVRATVPLLEAVGVAAVGLVVAVDRAERADDDSGRPALAALAEDLALTARAIATIDEVVARLDGRSRSDGRPILTDEDRERIARHRGLHGA